VVVGDDLEVADGGPESRYAREDVNVVFPLARLHELVDGGYVGSVAPFAYSFMGQITRPTSLLANYAPSVAYRMKRMGADVALVVAAGLIGHQTAGLVARAIELAGVPTVVLGTNRALLEAVRVPRAVVVKHPEGAPLGNPANAGKHQYLLREVFDAAWAFEGPGLVAELGFAWSGR
jgi:D-proline reductase (dithiol) PrdB